MAVCANVFSMTNDVKVGLMSRKLWIGLGVATLVVAVVVWRVSVLFSATVDWPMVVMSARADAQRAMGENGNYDGLPGEDFRAQLTAQGITDRVGFDTANSNAVVVTLAGMNERSCTGLQHHPMLLENFDVVVEGGSCHDNVGMRFIMK